MIRVRVEVLPMNADEVARAEVRVQDQDGAPWGLESGGRKDQTFDLEDGQELVVKGRTIGRMVLNRDQRATQVEYLEDEAPAPQSAYDPEKDPAVQKQREEEKARAEGRKSPSAFVDPNAKPMGESAAETRFTPIEEPPPSTPETETQAAARRMREEQQKRDTTSTASAPAQPVSPASLPSSAESKIRSGEPAAASAPGGAASSKDVKDEGAKGKT